jgi:hypothetical protein
MSHVVVDEGAGPRVEYRWRLGQCWNRLAVVGTGASREMVEGSLEQFIAEHYWGYCAQPDGGTIEYHVAHRPWRIWDVAHAEFSGDAVALYGHDFATILNRPADSAIFAEGSPVAVYAGTKLPYQNS